MSSFSCPHFDLAREHCLRLDTVCVPGRTGCVLRGNSVFAVPAEERIRRLEEQRQAQHAEHQRPE